MRREVYMSTMYCPVSKQITQLSTETQTRVGKSLVKCHASEPSWPTLAFQNLEPNTAAKLWAETQMPSSSKQRLPCTLCQASAGAHLGSSSRAKAGVCFSQLICDVPFYSWTLCPSQLTLELNFPTATWTRWLQKCSRLSVSPGKPAFSSTCSKKDGWTEHSSGSSLGWQSLCLKGAVADAMENLCRHGWLTAMQGRRKDLNIRCLLHQSRTGRSANPAPAQAAVALTWQNKTKQETSQKTKTTGSLCVYLVHLPRRKAQKNYILCFSVTLLGPSPLINLYWDPALCRNTETLAQRKANRRHCVLVPGVISGSAVFQLWGNQPTPFCGSCPSSVKGSQWKVLPHGSLWGLDYAHHYTGTQLCWTSKCCYGRHWWEWLAVDWSIASLPERQGYNYTLSA